MFFDKKTVPSLRDSNPDGIRFADEFGRSRFDRARALAAEGKPCRHTRKVDGKRREELREARDRW